MLMNSKRNKKLCWNCEGEIDKDAIHCLFCGTELKNNPPATPPEPPYRAKMAPQKEEQKEAIANAPAKKSVEQDDSRGALSFLLLLVGAIFLAFSLFLLIFSSQGVLTLSWNASYWFVYLLVSLPCLFFGWKALRNL